jgi:TM2 domain-containing membrane protein YozV
MTKWTSPRPKKKWIAGLTAFFVPGTGHFYLGQMLKGITIMLLISIDICVIVYVMTLENMLATILFSLMLPIIYFYSLFDAIQSTDVINERAHARWQMQMQAQAQGPAFHVPPPPASPAAGPMDGPAASSFSPEGQQSDAGADRWQHQDPVWTVQSSQPSPQSQPVKTVLFLAVIVGALLLMNMEWSGLPFKSSSSMVGAVILIAAGVGLWFWESRKDRGKES